MATRPALRPRLLRPALITAVLASACASGDEQDPGFPDQDTGVEEQDVGFATEDVGEPVDAGFPVEDVGVDVPIARDAGVDVPIARDTGVDVPTVRDAGVDVPRADVPSTDVPPVDVPRDVPVDMPPATCTGAASQSCGTCGTQTRTCTAGVWSAWGTCVEPALAFGGNWSVSITPGGGGAAVAGLAAFSAPSSLGSLTGVMVDGFGYATLTAVTANACTRRVTFTKRYTVGTSTGTSFDYTATYTAGTPARLAGNWSQVGTPANTSTFSAQDRSGRTASTFAGAWRLSADWGSATSTTFTVSATGALDGTMVDMFGTSALSGAVDLNAGTVMFVKNYTSGSSVGQQYLYRGTMNATGTSITGGAWNGQGTAMNMGTWTAAR